MTAASRMGACGAARPLALALALMLAGLLDGARAGTEESGWADDGIAADAPPSGFTLHNDGSGAPAVHRSGAEVVLSCQPAKYCHLDADLTGSEGSDDQPLRIDCTLAIEDGAAVVGAPLLLALGWSGGAIAAVGLGNGGGERASRHWANKAWTASVVDGKDDAAAAGLGLHPGAAPLHVRLVVVTHAISAYASTDGWTWTRIRSWPRDAGFSGAPQRIMVGRGWIGARPGLDNDTAGGNGPARYRIGHLHISSAGASLPAELMKSYVKQDSREETIDDLEADGLVHAWSILGPLEAKDAGYGFEEDPPTTPLHAVGRLEWRAFVPEEGPNGHILNLQGIAPGLGENALRYAAATITAAEPRLERFLFDAERDVTLYLNGVELAQDWHDGPVEDDRLSATGWLQKGENRLLVRLGAGRKGTALLTLHHQPGDPLYHIALLRRLMIDFPDDSDANLQALEEIAQLWEGLGFQGEAVKAFEELAHSADASPDQVDAALTERTRLDRELGNDTRVAADVDELSKRWTDSSDPTTAQLKVARLWERMGQPDQAAAALTRAGTLAGSDHQQLLDIALERAVIHQGLKDPGAVITDLQAAVAALPAQDARRAELLVTLAEHQQRVGSDVGALLTQALAGAGPRELRRIAGLEALRQDRPDELAARARSLAICPDTLDAPGFALAQLHAAAGEFPAAAEALARAIDRLPGGERPEVQARLAQLQALPAKAEERYASLQGIAVEAMLRSSDDGAALFGQLGDGRDGLSALPSGPPAWRLVGPIPNGKDPWRCWADGYLRAAGIGPGAIDPDKPVEDLDWHLLDPSAFENGVLDLKAMLGGGMGGGIGNSVAILAADLTVDRDFATALNLGADDALRVVLNGKVVHTDRNAQRRFAADALQVPVSLVKGPNHLLVLVHHGGGGPWRVQVGLEGGTPVAAALRPALGRDPARAATARTLAALAERLARDGHYGQAAAVASTVLVCYGDQPETQLGLAMAFRELASQANDVYMMIGLEDWCEASAATLDPAREPWRTDLGWRCSELMAASGRVEGALALLEAGLRSEFQADRRAETLRRIGEIYRVCGFSRLATSTFTKALSLGVADGAWNATVRRSLARSRPPKGAHGAPDTSFELNNQMRMAEQAVVAKDSDHAIAGFQRAIEESPGQLCLTPDGHLRSAGSYAGECLRALDPAGQKLYLDHYEGRAQGQLDAAIAHHDLEACERIAATFPLTHAAAVALATAADGYAGRGAWGLAAGTWLQLLQQHGLTPAESLTAAERLADAAARAHDHGGLLAAEAMLARSAASVTVGGRDLAMQAWLHGLDAAFAPASAPALPQSFTAASLATYPCPPEELYDLCRIRRMDGPQVLFAPALGGDGGDVLALTCLTGTRVVDLARGTTRWSDAPEFPQLRSPARWGGFVGAPECQACMLGGNRICARVLRGGTCVIEARDLATGALLWSTEGGPLAAPGFLASSSPAAGEDRVFACVIANGQETLVALDAGDGHLLWQALLSVRRSGLTVQATDDIVLDGYLAPPLVLGRQVLVAPDLGELLSLDAGTGAIDWSASYTRGNFDPVDGAGALGVLAMRSPTRVLAAGDDRLLIAPRDSLSILAFTRGGALAWSRETASGRHLAGVSADGAVAVSEWLTVDAINTSDGSLRWSFQPRQADGQCTGHALIAGGEVLVPTDRALYRLALADGAPLGRQSWEAMGLGGPVAPWLFQSGHGLYGVGNNQLVCLTAPATAQVAGAAATIPPATAAGVERGASLPSAGLPPAPAGSPLAIDWRLAGDAVRSIDVPPGTPAGQCFVRFAHALGCFDIARHAIVWREPISVDTRAVAYTQDLVLCLHAAGVVALDRATGTPRWTTVCSQGVMDGMQMRTVPQPQMWVGERLLITCARPDGNILLVFSLADGRYLGQVQIDGWPCAAGDADGKLWICVHRRERLVMDLRDAASPGTKLAVDALIPASDRGDGAVFADGTVVIHNKTQAVRYDLATRTSHPFPLLGNVYDLHTDQGRPLAFVHGLDNRWTSAVLDAHDDKVLFSEVTASGDPALAAIYAYHVNGQHLVRFDADRKGKSGLVCRSLADGKEQWWLEGRDHAHRLGTGLAMMDRFAVASSIDIEGGMRYRLIDCDSGKEVAGGPIPGWSNGSLVPMEVLGGEWLYGTEQGLVCMQPTTAEAAGRPAGDGAIPQLPLSHALTVAPAPGEMVVDGHLDDWGAVAPVLLQVPAAARSGGGAALPLTATAAVRLCYDGDGVYVAVQVASPRCAGNLDQESALSGDGLLIGLDPRNLPWRGNAQVVAALALVDGETRLNINGKPELARGTDPAHAHARIACSAQGMTYELMVPWTVLHVDPTQLGSHPGMAVDILASFAMPGAPPRALELGWGLAEGWDPTCWQGLLLVPAKK